jgi:iron-sulfur cluster assembly protein
MKLFADGLHQEFATWALGFAPYGAADVGEVVAIADAVEDGDEVVERDGVRVLIDPRSAPIVRGSTLEFNDALLGGGLKMLNPQAKHECACGESFSI